MVNSAAKTIRDHSLIDRGDRVIVALSGGADSVALLNVLLSLRDELDITVMAAHVNHQLRSEESERDQQFVRNLCQSLSVELFVHTADVNALAEESGDSVELCGRKVRYEFFEKLSQQYGAKIATAHTLSDSEETMLYNIARGATLHGLCSIPYKREYIIRPLLDVTRQQIEDYCAENSLDFVHDSTNFQEDACKRNKIRLSVLPPLRQVSDGFHQNFSRLREQLTAVDRYMNTEALKALDGCRCEFGLSAEKLLTLDDALLGYALTQYITSSGATAEYRHISLCKEILRHSGAVCLPTGFVAVCRQGVFRVVAPLSAEKFSQMPLEIPMRVFYAGCEYSVRELSKDEILSKKPIKNCLSLDVVTSDTVLRTRAEGDTFTPMGRGITKPLRKLQNELKIPSEKRDSALLIATGSTVLWAEGIGVSQQAVSHATADKAICIEINRGE